jgi:hypothetical protein
MPTDRYTKFILTVIALCLIWLCIAWTGPAASAQQFLTGTRAQPVVVVGWGTIDGTGQATVTMRTDRGGKVRSDPTMPVRLAEMPAAPLDVRLEYTDARPLPVGVTSIKRTGPWEPIRSEVEPEPTRPRPGGR